MRTQLRSSRLEEIGTKTMFRNSDKTPVCIDEDDDDFINPPEPSKLIVNKFKDMRMMDDEEKNENKRLKVVMLAETTFLLILMILEIRNIVIMLNNIMKELMRNSIRYWKALFSQTKITRIRNALKENEMECIRKRSSSGIKTDEKSREMKIDKISEEAGLEKMDVQICVNHYATPVGWEEYSEVLRRSCSMNDDMIMEEEVKDPRSMQKQANVLETGSIKNQLGFSNECERVDNYLLNSNESILLEEQMKNTSRILHYQKDSSG
ncbi:hypothetical protein L2E82_31963 [Cichorium intybus]|uniref:Uncharacterized protein n=1 Tax=Cichorium intybus TaxID=13427 RepID=A0ACB9BF35_CICIN|nr:hypothetical protein L2E82_31963 [Cichorium intybus]